MLFLYTAEWETQNNNSYRIMYDMFKSSSCFIIIISIRGLAS